MKHIILWMEWSKAFSSLRSAFSRQITFFWAITYCSGLAVRTDIRGVSSVVSILGLKSSSYDALLRLCHSTAINLDVLLSCWVKLCFKLFQPICVDGYMVLLGDGIKVGKEGKKMPAVKLMHQSSASNSKAEYIMGHYLQAISLAVLTPLGRIAAIPLIAKIHDGIIYSNRSRQTVLDRFAHLVSEVSNAINIAPIIVADAYYANKGIIDYTKEGYFHLLSRVAHNTAANFPAKPSKKKKRGRPRVKGERIKLNSFFNHLTDNFQIYRFTCQNLYWDSAKGIVRFVICERNGKDRIILMSTKLDLDPVTMIKLYEKRWLIESGFKTAVHQIGTFAYHFWMKSMKPVKRKTKQYLHRETEEYREQIQRKMKAYHTHLAFGCITQGLMLHLAINYKDEVWASFNGWIRTIRSSVEPSEIVVSNALRSTLPNFLVAAQYSVEWIKFMKKKIDPTRPGMMGRAA